MAGSHYDAQSLNSTSKAASRIMAGATLLTAVHEKHSRCCDLDASTFNSIYKLDRKLSVSYNDDVPT